jgi:hypothetical protein
MTKTRKATWQTLYRYWQSKHAGGRPPAREDLDPPTEIPQFLAGLMIIDVLPTGYQYRLVGSALRDRLGGEFSGKAVGSSGQSESLKNDWTTLLDAVRGDWKPRMLVASVASDGALNNLMLVLPLIDRTGKLQCLLAGAFFSSGDFKPGSFADDVTIIEIEPGTLDS